MGELPGHLGATSRRGFLRAATGTAVVAGASAALGGTAAADASPHWGWRWGHRRLPKSKIGIQLYTVRGLMSESVEDTLTFLARVGYAEVEFAGLFGYTPEEMRALLDDLKLKAPASHDDIPPGREAQEELFEQARTLGQRWVVVPFFQADTIDAYRDLARHLNEAGELARRHGLRVGYHNHDHEFARISGTRPYDVLLDETDRHLVDFELDIYWAVRGGVDPLDLFEQAPRRFPLSHVKDLAPDGSFADVGEGTIDFGRVFAEKSRSGMHHYLVERDDLPHQRETARDSYRYLRNLTF